MKKKNLKIKQKNSYIKTRDTEQKRKGNKLLHNKIKGDLIRKLSTDKLETGTGMSEASNNAEKQIEDTLINSGLYVSNKLVGNNKIKKKQNTPFANKNEQSADSSHKNNKKLEPLKINDNSKLVNRNNNETPQSHNNFEMRSNNKNSIKKRKIMIRNNCMKVKKTKICEPKKLLIKKYIAEIKNNSEGVKNSINNLHVDKNELKPESKLKTLTYNGKHDKNTIYKTPFSSNTNYKYVDKKQQHIPENTHSDSFIKNNLLDKYNKKDCFRKSDLNQQSILLHSNHNDMLKYKKSKQRQFIPPPEKRYSAKQIKNKFMKENKHKAAKIAAKTETRISRRASQVISNTAVALIKSIVTALSSLGGVIVILIIITAVTALISTNFGIFYSPLDNSIGVKKVSLIVAETNNEFNSKVSDIENSIEHDSIEYHNIPSGGDNLFITNWPHVVSIFAARTSGDTSGALDVVTIDKKREEMLIDTFWDMNELSYETEKIMHSSEDEDDWTETILHITHTSKDYKEMIRFYGFTPYQEQAVNEMMKPEYAQMLSELIGTFGISGGNIQLTPKQIQEMLENLPEDLPPERENVLMAAYSLVGKVNYFWGGKSSVIGWDSRWGTPMKVTAAGSNTTGTIQPFGLDCSGFVTWAFINATNDTSYGNVIGHGAANQYSRAKDISWSEAIPGDLVFYPDLGHVGIVAGKDANGNLLIIHCASSQNNVVITGLQGFTKIRRPVLFE